MVVNLALDHRVLDQVQHAVDEHFRGHIQPLLEGATVLGDRRPHPAQCLHRFAVLPVVPVPQNQTVGHRIAQ